MPDISGEDHRGSVRPAAEGTGSAPRRVAPGTLVVVSGPSGAGKGTLIACLLQRVAGLQASVSATTRARRPGERDGVEYHFLAREEFERRVADGEFLEHAEYAGNLYGTLTAEVERIFADGASAVLEIELVGARAVARHAPDSRSIFIAPPSTPELERRLRDRGTNDDADIVRRLKTADSELAARDEFDRVVINTEVATACSELVDAVIALCGAGDG